jgi:hypothetical protein
MDVSLSAAPKEDFVRAQPRCLSMCGKVPQPHLRSEHANRTNRKLPMSNKTSFRFMDLPVEVRRLVSGLSFRGVKLRHGSRIGIANFEEEDRPDGTKPTQRSVSVGIIFVSKLCYAEARPILLTEATFHVRVPDPLPAPKHASPPLSLKDSSRIQHIALSMPSHFIQPGAVRKLIASFPNLRSVSCHFVAFRGPMFGSVPTHINRHVLVKDNGALDPDNLKLVEQLVTLHLPQCLRTNRRRSVADIHELLATWQNCGRVFELTLIAWLQACHATGDERIPYKGTCLVSLPSPK